MTAWWVDQLHQGGRVIHWDRAMICLSILAVVWLVVFLGTKMKGKR